MSRRPRGPRPAIVMVAFLVAALALAGCSAGTVTQTDTVVSGADGAVGHLGPIALLDVALVAGPSGLVPPGAEVPLAGTIVNQGPTPDRLIAVSSPYAAGVRQEGPTELPGNYSVRMVGDTPGPVGTGIPGTPQVSTMRLVLQGVNRPLFGGPTYDVTFTFERAGTVTVPVLVSSVEPSAG